MCDVCGDVTLIQKKWESCCKLFVERASLWLNTWSCSNTISIGYSREQKLNLHQFWENFLLAELGLIYDLINKQFWCWKRVPTAEDSISARREEWVTFI